MAHLSKPLLNTPFAPTEVHNFALCEQLSPNKKQSMTHSEKQSHFARVSGSMSSNLAKNPNSCLRRVLSPVFTMNSSTESWTACYQLIKAGKGTSLKAQADPCRQGKTNSPQSVCVTRGMRWENVLVWNISIVSISIAIRDQTLKFSSNGLQPLSCFPT